MNIEMGISLPLVVNNGFLMCWGYLITGTSHVITTPITYTEKYIMVASCTSKTDNSKWELQVYFEDEIAKYTIKSFDTCGKRWITVGV